MRTRGELSGRLHEPRQKRVESTLSAQTWPFRKRCFLGLGQPAFTGQVDSARSVYQGACKRG